MKTILKSILITVMVFGLAGVAAADKIVDSGKSSIQPAAAIEAYWTLERMANAIPYPSGIKGAPAQSVSPAEAPTGPQGFSTSSKTGQASRLLSSETTQAFGIDTPAGPQSYPFPHTTYRVYGPPYYVYPYRAVGKVFFSQSGSNYVCSGSSIGGRAVLTAGHCVSNGAGKWHTNWAFVPAYNGWGSTTAIQRPYGTWVSGWLSTWSTWFYNGKYCQDVGVAVTTNVGGKKLSQTVGYLGRTYNYTRSKMHWDAFGYPSASPWDGKGMVQTEAEWARDDNPGCTPYTMGIGTIQRPGSSGGPWISTFMPNYAGACNYAGSVFSYYYLSQPNGIYGPYFDTSINNWLVNYIAK